MLLLCIENLLWKTGNVVMLAELCSAFALCQAQPGVLATQQLGTRWLKPRERILPSSPGAGAAAGQGGFGVSEPGTGMGWAPLPSSPSVLASPHFSKCFAQILVLDVKQERGVQIILAEPSPAAASIPKLEL